MTGGGDEECRGWHEICEGWRGGLDSSGEKEEEEECYERIRVIVGIQMLVYI